MGSSFAVLSLPLLTGTGTSWHTPGPYDQIGEAALDLPLLTISAASSGVSASAVLTMPSMTATGAAEQSGYHTADLYLPAMEATGTILHGSALEASIELPQLSLDASLAAGWVAQGAMTLPAFEVSASDLGATAALELPFLTIDADALTGFAGEAALDLPVLTISAVMVHNVTATAALTLPILQVSAAIGFGNKITADVSMPFFTISAALQTGETLTAALTFPALTISAGAGPSLITMTGAITLPIFIAEGMLTQDLIADLVLGTAEFSAFVLNTRSFGLSSYANFGFNSFAKVAGVYLGANQNGIYTLSSETDAGTNIDAEIAKEKIDNGTGQHKRAGDVYLGLRKGGDFILELTYADATGSYTLSDEDENPHRARIKTGKGLKGAYWGFNLTNVDGADFTINDLEFNLDVQRRKER